MLEFSETRDEWILKICQWMEFVRAGLPSLESSNGRLCPQLTLPKGSLSGWLRQAEGFRQYLGLRGFSRREDQLRRFRIFNPQPWPKMTKAELVRLMPATIKFLTTYDVWCQWCWCDCCHWGCCCQLRCLPTSMTISV